MDEKKIVDYYNYLAPYYKHFWHGKTEGLHFGYWDTETKTHRESLLNTNRFLANLAKISKNDLVLDAGCGIGGSSLWLAKNQGCKVHGVTISPEQIERAERRAKLKNLEKQVSFTLQDYNNLNFPDETFDVIWAIESVCHAKEKESFLKEAFRVLKKNGRLVMSDGFLLRNPQGNKEQIILDTFLEGWALDNLSIIEEFESKMKATGFTNIKIENKKSQTLSESKYIYNLSLLGYPLSLLTTFLGLTSNILVKNIKGGLAQKKLIENDIMNLFAVIGYKQE